MHQESLFLSTRRKRRATHVEVLVEDQTSEVVVHQLLARCFGEGPPTWKVHSFQGKADLLVKLPQRLRALKRILPPTGCVIVLLDRDRDDCVKLKRHLDDLARSAGMSPTSDRRDGQWMVASRIAIEEVESWFIGDAVALAVAFPGFPGDIGLRAPFRDPDAVKGGTSEALERELKKSGHMSSGLRKVEVAHRVAPHLDPDRNRSKSFRVFWETLKSIEPHSD